MFLFVYGSLVSRASAAGTMGGEVVPVPAMLMGWERSWSVGTGRASHPERRTYFADGREFAGVMGVLGVAEAAGRECGGAVYPVSGRDLERFDGRERNYVRRDVSADVRWVGKPSGCVVLTYVPTPVALARLRDAAARGEAVIRREYLALVEDAFQEFGALEGFRRTTVGSDLPVRSLRVELG